jgi:hypothetical protein
VCLNAPQAGKKHRNPQKRAVNPAPTISWVPGITIPEPKKNAEKVGVLSRLTFFRSLLVLLGHKMCRINNIETIDLKTRILLSEMARTLEEFSRWTRSTRFCARLVRVSSRLRPCTKGTLDCFVRTCWAGVSKAGGTRSVISLEEQVSAA